MATDERFFDIFPDRQLAADLFAVAEDARIDVLISQEYGGIRRPYGDRQERELDRRADVTGMPLRQAFVENYERTRPITLPFIATRPTKMSVLILI